MRRHIYTLRIDISVVDILVDILFLSLETRMDVGVLAERGGFEPPKPLKGLHAFQACALNHSATSPKENAIIWDKKTFVISKS